MEKEGSLDLSEERRWQWHSMNILLIFSSLCVSAFLLLTSPSVRGAPERRYSCLLSDHLTLPETRQGRQYGATCIEHIYAGNHSVSREHKSYKMLKNVLIRSVHKISSRKIQGLIFSEEIEYSFLKVS